MPSTANWGRQWSATSGTSALATTTSTLVVAAPSTVGTRVYVSGLELYNSSGSVATVVSLLSGSTVIWTGWLNFATQGTSGTSNSLSNTSVEITFPDALRLAPDTALNIQCGTSGASVYWNVQGYYDN